MSREYPPPPPVCKRPDATKGRIDTGAHELTLGWDESGPRVGPPGRDGRAGSPASRAAQFAPQYGNPPLAPTPLRTGVNGHLVACADMPPTMPNPESETQKNSRWVRSNSFGAALGGPAYPGGHALHRLAPVSGSAGWVATACLLPPWRRCQPERRAATLTNRPNSWSARSDWRHSGGTRSVLGTMAMSRVEKSIVRIVRRPTLPRP